MYRVKHGVDQANFWSNFVVYIINYKLHITIPGVKVGGGGIFGINGGCSCPLLFTSAYNRKKQIHIMFVVDCYMYRGKLWLESWHIVLGKSFTSKNFIYRIMQIAYSEKLSRLKRLVDIYGKTFAVASFMQYLID